jgi:predicted P-loop ATPase
MTQEEVDQIWAEAMHYYDKGENIMHLPADILQATLEMQEKHSQSNEYYGAIEEYLKTPIPMNWDDLSVQDRRQWLSASDEFKDENQEPRKLRDRVSPIEIWVECFQREAGSLTRMISMTINDAMTKMPGWTKDETPKRYGPYGRQRGYHLVDPTLATYGIKEEDLPF